MRTEFPDPANTMHFELTITPDEGLYRGGSFLFTVSISQNYPHDPPKVKCTQKVRAPAGVRRSPRRYTTRTSTWTGTCA